VHGGLVARQRQAGPRSFAAPSAFVADNTRAKADKIPGWQAEYFIFGNHHAEIGNFLLKLWGLSASVVETGGDAPHAAWQRRRRGRARRSG